jgi:glycosyltransferase involved in cell wall biosynthesis/O-antigen/teichoic acid export membrane protein
LHILVLSDRDWTHPQAGGTGTNLFGQVSRWIAWGHRVTVVACSYPGAPPVEHLGPLTIHRMGGRSTVFPRVIWKQWRGLVPDADVVLEVVNGISFLTPLWMRTPRVTLVHHIHREHYIEEMGPKGRLAAFLLETAPLSFLYRASRFLTISEASAVDIARHGIPREQIEVSYIGVEHEAYPPDPSRRTAEPSLLYLGRLKRYKRIEVVLDVLEACPDAMLDVAGDGDYRPDLEREIAARGLAERVRMHGFVSEERKRALLQGAWVNLTASSAEGWCLTVMEAAACETPSVALDVGGLRESIEHERTGLLARDPRELGRQTRRLLEDHELRRRLGRAARERALEFTWDRTARESLALLERARAAPGEPGALRRRLARSDTGRAAGLAGALIATNVIALAFTIVFARLLGASGYGSLGALIAAFTILLVPGSALQAAVAREVSAAASSGRASPGVGVRRWVERLLVVTVVLTAASVLLREPIASLVGVNEHPWAAAAILPSGAIWLVLCVQRGALQGFRRYGVVGLSIVGEACARLVLGLALYAGGLGVTGAFLGTTLSVLTMSIVLAAPLARELGPPEPTPPGVDPRLRRLLGRAWAPVLAFSLIAALQNIDIVYVKHHLSDSQAGSYAAASVAAKAVIWVAIGLGLYLLPEAVRRTRTGADARPVLYRTLSLVGAVAVPMVLVYAVAGHALLAAVFGSDLTAASRALPLLGLGMSLLACGYLGVQYLLALGRSSFVVVLALAAVVELATLIAIGFGLTGVALVVAALQVVLAPIVLGIGLRSAATARAPRGAIA